MPVQDAVYIYTIRNFRGQKFGENIENQNAMLMIFMTNLLRCQESKEGYWHSVPPSPHLHATAISGLL